MPKYNVYYKGSGLESVNPVYTDNITEWIDGYHRVHRGVRAYYSWELLPEPIIPVGAIDNAVFPLDEPKPNKANPKQAYGDKKVALQLVPSILDIEASLAMKEGADKYGPYNWRIDAVEAMTYIGAIKRHFSAYIDGEDIDLQSKTGKTHLGGIAANVAILLDAAACGKLIDNRPPKCPSGQRIRDLENGNT